MPQNPTAAERIRAALQPGEELRWLGHPGPSSALRRRYRQSVVVVVVLAGVFWGLLSYDPDRQHWWRPLLLLCFATSILFFTAPFWMPLLIRRWIAYAVTTHRVLITGLGTPPPLRVFQPHDLREMVILEEEDGTYSLLFETGEKPNVLFDPNLAGFFNLKDGQAVEELIRKTLLENPPSSLPTPEPAPETTVSQPVATPLPTQGSKKSLTSKDYLIGALEPEERVLWLGSPQSLLSRRVPFGWIGIGCFLFALATLLLEDGGGQGEGHGPLHWVRFWLILAGIFNGFLTFPLRALLGALITYAVTDRRVIIVSEFFTEKVRSVPPEKMGQVVRLANPGHWESVLWEEPIARLFPLRGWLPGFLFLKDASLPEELIRTVLVGKQPIPEHVPQLTQADLQLLRYGPPPPPPATTPGEKVRRGLKQAGQGILSFGCLVIIMAAIGLAINYFRGVDSYFLSTAFTPDGKRLVANRLDGALVVWDVETGEQVLTRAGRPYYLRYVVAQPEGVWYEEARIKPPEGSTPTIEFHDVLTDEVRLRMTVVGGRGSNTLTPDGKTLIAMRGPLLQLWDVPTKKLRHSITSRTAGETFTLNFGDVALHPDGKRLLTAGGDKFLRVWDLATEKELTRWETHSGNTNRVRIHPNGILIATVGDKPRTGSKAPTRGEVRLWDLEKRQETPLEPPYEGRGVAGITFNPKGTLLAAADYDHHLRVWDTTTGKEVFKHFERGSHGYHGLSFSPDGRWLAAGSPDDCVLVWEVATWHVKYRLK
jgi:hypothetical protein